MFDVNRLAAIQVGLASPERIREWSHGEVTKSETVNYRTQKPEMDGLFCERIFGPAKDYECHCGKYKKIRFAGITCERCGVEVISKEVRRERMGHIELASPCTHIWYLRGIPSRIALLLDIPQKQLEEVAYFSSHICLNPGTSRTLYYREILDEGTARSEFQLAINEFLNTLSIDSADYAIGSQMIEKMANRSESFEFLTIAAYISKHTGAEFGDGAIAIKRLLQEVKLEDEFKKITEELKDASGQKKAKLLKRLDVVQAFRNSKNRPEWMVLECLPVIPPDLRPMLPLDGGRNAVSDINELYRRVINRNNRLKKLVAINAPIVILNNEKRMVQEAVDALIDNGHSRNKPVVGIGGRQYKSLSSGLKGKQGRFRQNLLGKRVDYSGRSVIAVGPDLKMYQCGIPREMAVQLLRPYIAHLLIKRGYVSAHKAADKIIDQYDPIVYDIVEEIIDQHPVLLNRAPTLHRLGIQAFQAKLVDGRAIRLHPLVCAGFNADFDGDQMAVHVPLSKAAQEEALNRMLASNNILGPKDGKPIVTPSQDMVLGNYYLTLEESKKNLLDRAGRRQSTGDIEEYELFEAYGNAEGKVFASVDEVLTAYATKRVHLHTRIALRGASLLKVDGENNRVDDKKFITAKEINESYLVTTVGKVIFNLIFPSDFPFLNDMTKKDGLKGNLREYFVKGKDLEEKGMTGYIDEQPLREPFKKKDLSTIIDEVYHRYGTSKTSAVLDKLKDQGFKYSTVAGFTIALSDIPKVQGKEEILKEGDEEVNKIEEFYNEGLLSKTERHEKIIDVWKKVRKDVADKLLVPFKQDRRNPLYMISDSGARGKEDNIIQLAGMRGLMSKPTGETIELPIKSCFREGQDVGEFFNATHGARKGGADTALKTADSGYLTRRLVDVSQDVIVREDDCGTDHGFVVHDILDTTKTLGGSSQVNVITTLYERLVGRFSLRDIKDPKTHEVICEGNTLIDEITAQKIVDAGIKEVEIRSLFGCETKNGVCVHCYGRNLATGLLVKKGEAVGIMAAQSIGEPGTQLTLRTFHSGGVAQSDITEGLPRVQELVEARVPKGEALISEISGKVTTIEEQNGRYKFVVSNDLEEKEYLSVFGARPAVKRGDHVDNGGQLTEGSINPKKLLEVCDARAVEEYMLNEIQKPYRINAGIGINDKHIEVIVRQMLRKVIVVDSGDTNLVPGTKMNIDDFTSENENAILNGKRPAVAKQLLLGITKAALETKSFLSAASFQETTRVLTDAAVKAKRDDLHGLKENVITGKLIPAGTGLLGDEEEEANLSKFSVDSKMHQVQEQYIEELDKLEDTH